MNDLRQYVPQALVNDLNYTILAYYHCCQRKMNFYQKSTGYSPSYWKPCTSHYKPINKNEDR